MCRKGTLEVRVADNRFRMLCDKDVAPQAHRDVLAAVLKRIPTGRAGGEGNLLEAKLARSRLAGRDDIVTRGAGYDVNLGSKGHLTRFS